MPMSATDPACEGHNDQLTPRDASHEPAPLTLSRNKNRGGGPNGTATIVRASIASGEPVGQVAARLATLGARKPAATDSFSHI